MKRQTFDATYCSHSHFCVADCEFRILPETVAAVPEYRGISYADFKTSVCGYKEKQP